MFLDFPLFLCHVYSICMSLLMCFFWTIYWFRKTYIGRSILTAKIHLPLLPRRESGMTCQQWRCRLKVPPSLLYQTWWLLGRNGEKWSQRELLCIAFLPMLCHIWDAKVLEFVGLRLFHAQFLGLRLVRPGEYYLPALAPHGNVIMCRCMAAMWHI